MTENFLDFTEDDLDDSVEPTTAEPGEHTIELSDWKVNDDGKVIRKDSNGNPYIMPIFEVVDEEGSEYIKSFTHFVRLPHEDMNKKELNSCKFALKEFFNCFGVDYHSRIDYEEIIGARGDVLLLTSADEGYGEQNKIKKFIAPR